VKTLITAGLLALPLLAIADPQPMNMDPAQMQKMMNMDPAQMQKMMMDMQTCMQKVKREDMDKLKLRGEKMHKEIKALCQDGKRDQAQTRAIAYGKEMMNAPELVQIRKCSEQARGMMPAMDDFEDFSEEKYKNKHVCDTME